jgi:hypothetical protein
MIGPILPFLVSIPGWIRRWIHAFCASRAGSDRLPAGIAGINTLVNRRMLRLGPADDISVLISHLDENAERNRVRIAEQCASLLPGQRPPSSLLYRTRVVAMIDPEILGVLLSFSHPEDLDRVFEMLAELRDDPAGLTTAAAAIAGSYLERGLEHAGRLVDQCPLAGLNPDLSRLIGAKAPES